MGRNSIAHIRKPDILRHTYHLIAEKGLAGTSINKIANRMNANPGIVMHYFKNKEGLILALVDYMLERAETFYDSVFEKYDDPRQNFKYLAQYYFQIIESPPGRQSVFWSCYALGFRNERVKRRIQNMYQKFLERIVDRLAYWEEKGLVKVENKQEVSAILLSLIEGFGYFRITMGENMQLEKVAAFYKKTFLEVLGAAQLFEP